MLIEELMQELMQLRESASAPNLPALLAHLSDLSDSGPVTYGKWKVSSTDRHAKTQWHRPISPEQGGDVEISIQDKDVLVYFTTSIDGGEGHGTNDYYRFDEITSLEQLASKISDALEWEAMDLESDTEDEDEDD